MKTNSMRLLCAIFVALIAGTFTASAQDSLGFTVVKGDTGADASPNAPIIKGKSKVMSGGSTSSITSLNGEPGYNVFVWAVKGPLRSNADAFDPWSTNVVDHVRIHGKPPVSLAFDYALKTTDISQNTQVTTNDGIWVVVHVIRKSWADKLLPSRLQFVGVSSDTNHYLNTSSSLSADPNYTFTLRARGYNWNGPRGFNDSVLASVADGRLGEVAVDEFIFIGQQWNYFTYPNQAGYNAIHSYVMGHTNFMLTGTWSLTDGAGNVVGKGSKTLATKIPPLMPQATIMDSNPNVHVSANMAPGTTGILYSSPSLQPLQWTLEGTVNVGEHYIRPKNPDYGFFKVDPM